ncbi:hypothetical protein BD779DRAFT_1431990, partial [Infundibulicybe gibba]
LPFASCHVIGFQPQSPHVHFPPTPTLTSTATTHSPFAYDRAPIAVAPNACALPERGGRVYMTRHKRGSSDSWRNRDQASAPEEPKGSYFHPRAFEACEPEQTSPPSLIPDTTSSSGSSSSESDESGGLRHSRLMSNLAPTAHHYGYYSTPHSPMAATFDSYAYPPIPHTRSQEELDLALSFLPHPPSDPSLAKDTPQSQLTTAPKKKRLRPSLDRRASSFREPSGLDGCLGGF